ncbi:hypothetical protein C8A03DRAFT_37958, partial [Achaetomium macrosporum]
MRELEETARRVLRALRRIDNVKYSNLRVAVIGGLARMHYDPRGRVTEDVDFFVDIPGFSIPTELKTAIEALDGFSQTREVFYYAYDTPEGKHVSHKVDFIARNVCPYRPSAAQRIRDIPQGVIPYISRKDLVVFKIESCGVRKQTKQGLIDAIDAETLLSMVKTPLALTPQQQAIVEDRIEDVMSHCKHRPRWWWRKQLGLPEEDEEDEEKEGREGDNEGDKEGGKEGDEGSSEEDVEEDTEEDNTLLYFSSC